MGGIIAGRGFDFQTRYAACQLPIWLKDKCFHQLFYEGTGDVDIRFQQDGRSSRIHLQVKDHEVSVLEFKEVIAHFRTLDAQLPGTYQSFTLVCPSLAAKLRSVESGLARFRNAKPFYDDAAEALAPTKEELDARLRKIGLSDESIDFVHAKLSFDVGHSDLHHDDRATDLFVGRLLSHPSYEAKFRAMVQPAFAELLRAIDANRGSVLERSHVEQILQAAVVTAQLTEKTVTLCIHNWTREAFEGPTDYLLDWSECFERSSRRVPSPEIWDGRFLPELTSLRQKIAAERAERIIRFRGKCALSTGVALGATFPIVGGWIFEIPQPPSKRPWRSDAKPTSPNFQFEVVGGDETGTDLVVGLNIRGDAREEILQYIRSSGRIPKLFVFMEPSSKGSQSIAGSEEACGFAQFARERIGEILKQHHVRGIRLFFYGPFAFAVFLGQQLTSLGEIQLFEYQDPGCVPSCLLKT
jgi:CBASS immunity sensor of nucleotide second messenger signals/Cap4-like dsDNA endonuclease family protein